MITRIPLSVFALVNVLGWATVLLSLSQDTCMAVPLPPPTTLTLSLLADINGKFVTARPNDTALANGSSNLDHGSQFYVTYPMKDTLRLESVDYPGNFLMVDELGFLTLSGDVNATESDTHLWEQLNPFSVSNPNVVFRTFLNETACFMAFDISGESLPACENITSDQPETKIGVHYLD